MGNSRDRISEATKLELLADLAAVKGRPDLAQAIRRAARILSGSTPSDRARCVPDRAGCPNQLPQ